MKYTQMSNNELYHEIIRVRSIVLNPPNSHAYHQNKKYLEKLERERRNRYEKGNG